MAITINWLTKVISIPQADLTFVTGTLYEADTDAIRLELKSIEADEGMPFVDTHRHNTEVSVAGTTFARIIEIINGYSIEFTPDAQYSVRLLAATTISSMLRTAYSYRTKCRLSRRTQQA